MSSSGSYGNQLPSLSGGYGSSSAYGSGQASRPTLSSTNALFSPPALGNGGQLPSRMPYDGSFTGSTSYSSTTTASGSIVSPRTPGTTEYVHHPVPTTSAHLPSVTAGAFLHPQNGQSSFALHLPQRMRGAAGMDEHAAMQHHQQHQEQQPQLVRSGYAANTRYPAQREAGPDDLAPIKREAQRIGPLGAA